MAWPAQDDPRPGRPAVFADVSSAKCIWQWTRPLPTSAPSRTPNYKRDNPVKLVLLHQIPKDEDIGTVTAGGA